MARRVFKIHLNSSKHLLPSLAPFTEYTFRLFLTIPSQSDEW